MVAGSALDTVRPLPARDRGAAHGTAHGRLRHKYDLVRDVTATTRRHGRGTSLFRLAVLTSRGEKGPLRERANDDPRIAPRASVEGDATRARRNGSPPDRGRGRGGAHGR